MTTRTNTREQHCENCGTLVAPGAGSLAWNPGEDDGGDGHERYEVTCLDTATCAAIRAQRDAARRAELSEAAAKNRSAAEESEARSAEILARVAALVAEHGLEAVDSRRATVSLPNGAQRTWTASERHPARSTLTVAEAFETPSGVFVVVGDTYPTIYAPPAVVAAGHAQWRVAQHWMPSWGVARYPGPAVPDTELTPEELAQVSAWRAAKVVAEAEEKSAMARRMLGSYVESAPVAKNARRLGAARWEITDALAAAYSRGEVVTVPVVATLSAEHFDAKGKLRGEAKKSLGGTDYYADSSRKVQLALTVERGV